MTFNPSFSWPAYVQPRPGAAAPPASDEMRLPTSVVDMFYLQTDPRQAPMLICVLACLGGSLLVVDPALRSTLSAELQTQIQAAEINRRGHFRRIHAQDLWVATLDALEQDVAAAGYNDAVTLYGRMHALVDGSSQQGILGLANDVRMTVGRLDCLYGWRLGFAAPFQHPLRGEEVLIHALIPVAPCAAIQHGCGLALVYPLLDPARFTNLDNRPLVLGIVYDLLAQLQHDLRAAQPDHRLATLPIPVPSRQQLEADLCNDGYSIRGDLAVRQTDPSAPAAAQSLLSRLRQWTASWSAGSIRLPPQATVEEYAQLIDDVLQAITTPGDLAMIHALRQCLLPQTAPTQPAAPPVQPPPVGQAPRPATTAGARQPDPQAQRRDSAIGRLILQQPNPLPPPLSPGGKILSGRRIPNLSSPPPRLDGAKPANVRVSDNVAAGF